MRSLNRGKHGVSTDFLLYEKSVRFRDNDHKKTWADTGVAGRVEDAWCNRLFPSEHCSIAVATDCDKFHKMPSGTTPRHVLGAYSARSGPADSVSWNDGAHDMTGS